MRLVAGAIEHRSRDCVTRIMDRGGSPIFGLSSHTIFEAPAIVSDLDDVAVVGQTIQKRAGHFGIDKHAAIRPEARLVVTMIEVRS